MSTLPAHARTDGRQGRAGRRVLVETPEHVTIGYPLADLGSRFTALLIDALIVILLLVALMVGVPWAVRLLSGSLPPWLGGWGLGALTLLSFALSWGYFVAFEAFWGGQTPGKRRMGIRVVHDGGYPLTLQGAAIRNLLRAVDSQPAFTWLVGGAAMLMHPAVKRLGDLAAGTMVVREEEIGPVPELSAGEKPAFLRPELGEGEFAALDAYIARRSELNGADRKRIAATLADRLGRRPGVGGGRQDADAYLRELHGEETRRRAGRRTGEGAAAPRAIELARRQRAAWTELRLLSDRARRGRLVGLAEDEVSRFAELYRSASADLARARTYGASPALIAFLERLVAAAHNLLYRPNRPGLLALRRWLVAGFPRLVRRRWMPIAAAALFFYLPALLGYAVARVDSAWARSTLPVEMTARVEEGAAREAAGRGYVEVDDVFMPVMASGLIANNVQVTFFAFAGGIAAGIGTAAILVLNGVFLGAVAGVFANAGLSLYLWSFVLPHGVVELTAITIAGGAGLWLGSALLLPGRITRREALERRGREAVSLIAGTTMLLVAAGIIEGFISPSTLPRAVKLSLAGVFALTLLAYLTLGGRADPSPRSARDASPRGTD